MRCYVTLSNVFQLMHINMILVFTADKSWTCLCFIVLPVTVYTVGYVYFVGIKFLCILLVSYS